MYNLSADLAKNLQVYTDFINTRAAVNYPAKMDVPMVWDMYMDTAKPVGEGLSAPIRQDYAPAPIDYTPVDFGSEAITPVTYQSPVTGDLDLLGLVNDRLKTQSRRYPHPITNEMEDFH
ncbi:hypothetical protein V6615_05690 [Oscillospiraceae bacterium PP1C4]